ncbi:hypothetical protein C8P68_10977 [Mucilaginibacter yixingensis]|uniref:Secreted protein n=1 Tax=Mucilaginibacter yixingensis TaxID=1295612 RepID=A0A2T5J5J1_9SPHI|nr:SIMPL domain-containing protein [Mucilaginibacter yixingensis]PTQ93205.1 hypothetical protein C8P68_10977 [Mucilaginibacter yixingensis]
MKKLSFIIALLLLNTVVFAQSVDLRRKIEVTGIAEKEVTPDIINVSISLKEYMDGKNKVSISQLESQLEKAIAEAGIPKADFTINNLSSYNYVIQKKKNPDFLASKQYNIRFHDLNKYNEILSKVDPKGIQSTNIAGYDYSKMPELKKELNVLALTAARDKATYMLTALNEKLGSVINITLNDMSGGDVVVQARVFKAANVSAGYMDGSSADDSDLSIRPMKFTMQVNAVFEIGK